MIERESQKGFKTPARSFRLMAVGAFLALNLVAAGALAHYLMRSWGTADAQAKMEGANLATVLDTSITHLLSRQVLLQRAVGGAMEGMLRRGSVNLPELKNFMTTLEKSRDGARGRQFPIVIYGKTGDPLWSNLETNSDLRSITERDYFKRFQAGAGPDLVFTPLLEGRNTKKWGIVSALRLRGPHGEFAGVVTSQLQVDFLKELLLQVSVGSSDAIVLRDARDGSLLVRVPERMDDEERGAIGTKRLPAELMRAWTSGLKTGQVFSTDTLSGGERLLSFTINEHFPVMSIVGLGMDSRRAVWAQQVRLALGLWLLFVMGSGLTLWGAIRYQANMDAARRREQTLRAELEQEFERRNEDWMEATLDARRAAEQLAESERLASLGAMSAGVIHELNTPLGNSLLSASTIVTETRKIKDELTESQGKLSRSELLKSLNRIEQLAELLESGVARASELAGTFKQVAMDQSSGRRREFDVRATLGGVIRSFGVALKRAPAKVSVSLRGGEGVMCDSYPGTVIQIASNLMQNALRHAFEGRSEGLIIIEIEEFDRMWARWIRVTFRDDGVGMPPEMRERAFETFATNKTEGGGVGLALSQNLARKVLCGDLTLSEEDSDGGVGFVLEFPKKRPPETPRGA